MAIRYKALKKTKEEIINHLRKYLANIDNYRELIPPELSEEHILATRVFDTEPQDLTKFPLVIINSGNGDIITAGLGDMAQEIYHPMTGELIGYRYGGIYDFNLTLEIGTKSTLSREFLTDLITTALRVHLKRKIEAKGIIIKSIRYAGESTVQYNSDHIYVATLNLSTWSEWYEDVELLPDVNININN